MCQDVPQSVGALPDTLSWQQISAAVKQGRQLLVIGDEVYDVAEWVHKHPGGKVLLTYVGEDATDVTADLLKNTKFTREGILHMEMGRTCAPSTSTRRIQ